MLDTELLTKSVSRRITLIVLATLAGVLLGCASMSKSRQIAEAAVDVFHAQLDSERYTEIYAQSDEEFKKSTRQEDLEKFLKAVHQKLGKVKSAHQTGWTVSLASEGSLVTLTYDTGFIDGNATEQFVWHVMDNRA